ncbi:MAG: 50S ribosomal protein L22 [candidate division WS6 bacterium OLB20]|uniref:Large ribosomal subunit protein uL22 n=1 Tax=candidate division WS6 bacterium OLB20 TaxID=1617426 RepID=A0A136LX10_9BACT|nr:MAG: 50S ribosomal protein L22 [candidate division WS6 bacterium OLB20]
MSTIVYAKTKYVRRSARKIRLVADMIRGKNAQEALAMLQFVNKGAADEVTKTLASAMANAVHNNDMDKDTLVVSEVFINEAPTFRRGRAVSKGRYHKILKRNSHIIIGVSEPGAKKEDKKSVKAKAAPAAKKETKATAKKKETDKTAVKTEKKPAKAAAKPKAKSTGKKTSSTSKKSTK